MAGKQEGATSNGHRLVTLDELLALPLPTEEVELTPDMTVTLHALRGDERQKIAEAHKKDADVGDRLKLQHEVIAACWDTTADKVSSLPAPWIDKLGKAATRLSGFAPDAEDAAEQGLKATPSVVSGLA